MFDRSHYEDVLVVRVHQLVPADEVEGRYDEINTFESELIESGTRIVRSPCSSRSTNRRRV